MTMQKELVLCVWVALLSALPCLAKYSVEISTLTVEGRNNPLGLDIVHPRFGWVIHSEKKGVVQEEYRIVISSTRENAENLKADVWDSGIVGSDSSQWVQLHGFTPEPNKEYYWRVWVKANRGKPVWSETNRWSTGLLTDRHWKGEWIGTDSLCAYDNDQRHSRCTGRYLRKEFSLEKEVKRATVHVSGLGVYTLYINGKRVGKDWLTPVATDYTKTVAYNTYDVTALMQRDNAIGTIVQAGYFFAPAQNYQTNVRTTYGTPRLRLNLIVEYADGTCETIASDSTWKMHTNGAVRYSNLYDGEMHDSRLEFDGWTRYGFDDWMWEQADVVSAPGGVMRGNVTEPIRVYRTDRPIGIYRYGERFILDFGSNDAGVLRLRIKANHGDTIRIRHAELLQPNDSTRLYTENLRSAEQTAWYVSNGEERMWSPEYTWFGFRYAEVTGVEELNTEDVERLLLSDGLDDSGNSLFIEGNETLNRIIEAARRGIRSNYKGMPLDCPQRDERMPWLGDRTTGCLGESYLLDVHPLYAKWLGDIRECQRQDGAISDVAPAYWRLYNTNITWPAALPFGCDMLYRQYGDLRPMLQSYESIHRWLGLIRKKSYKDGLVTYDRYGDWCVPPESLELVHSKDSSRITDGVLIASCYYYHICRMMAHYAPSEVQREYYTDEAEATRESINCTFLHDSAYSNSTVTANLLPLAMGIVPEECEQAVKETLLRTISVQNDYKQSCGVIGIQWLMRYLSEIGESDIALRIASSTDYPGWGYMIANGATTIWELWNGNTANPSMNSGNHVMLLGDLIPWCFEYLAGIRPDADRPGFKHIVFKPDFSSSSLQGAKASHRSSYGIIRSEWTRRGNKIHWSVEVPANTTAEVHFPNGKVKDIGSGIYKWKMKD